MEKPVTLIDLGRGYVATVYSDTFERLRLGSVRWRPQIHRRAGKVYAQAHKAGLHFALHRVIAGAFGKGVLVDHKDGDGLNNRDDNLRIATPGQNAHNRKRDRDNRSGFKGVTWAKSSRKWMAQIIANGRQHYLGVFEHKERAAKAYDRAAIRLHGAFANLNFPDLRNSYRADRKLNP